MKVILIGAGGHAAEIADYIDYNNEKIGSKIQLVGLLDDNPNSYSNYSFTAPYLGSIKNHEIQNDVYYIVAIANIQYRRPIATRFIEAGAKFHTLIHASAYISKSAKIGEGVVIAPNVNVGPNVSLGNFNMINARASLGHDSKIGDFNFITPNVCFSGNSKIGDDNMFGINSATIPSISVGNRNKIAAGMVLDKNVEDDTVVFHRFKEKVIAVQKIA